MKVPDIQRFPTGSTVPTSEASDGTMIVPGGKILTQITQDKKKEGSDVNMVGLQPHLVPFVSIITSPQIRPGNLMKLADTTQNEAPANEDNDETNVDNSQAIEHIMDELKKHQRQLKNMMTQTKSLTQTVIKLMDQTNQWW